MSVRIRKRNGTWWIFICYCGKRKAKKIGTREAAERVKREIEARLALGDVGIFEKPEPTVPTFAQYAERWMRVHVAASCKRSTIGTYSGTLKLRLLPRFGATPIDKITRADIKEFLAELVASPEQMRRRTILFALAILRSMFSSALDDGLIQVNPAIKLGKLTQTGEEKFKATPFEPEQAARFIEAARQFSPEFFYPAALVALRAGLRRGEVIGLKFGDIQFGESEHDRDRHILVQRSVSRGKFTTPKNKQTRRVDLSRELRAVLLEHRDRRLLQAFASGKSNVSDELVFPSSVNTPLSPDRLVEDFFHPCLELAGLRSRRFHDLRHTFAYNLIRAGAPMAYIRDQLGHSSIAITVDIYGHLQPGADVDWMEKAATSLQPSATRSQLRKTTIIGEPGEALSIEGVIGESANLGVTTSSCRGHAAKCAGKRAEASAAQAFARHSLNQRSRMESGTVAEPLPTAPRSQKKNSPRKVRPALRTGSFPKPSGDLWLLQSNDCSLPLSDVRWEWRRHDSDSILSHAVEAFATKAEKARLHDLHGGAAVFVRRREQAEEIPPDL